MNPTYFNKFSTCLSRPLIISDDKNFHGLFITYSNLLQEKLLKALSVSVKCKLRPEKSCGKKKKKTKTWCTQNCARIVNFSHNLVKNDPSAIFVQDFYCVRALIEFSATNGRFSLRKYAFSCCVYRFSDISLPRWMYLLQGTVQPQM